MKKHIYQAVILILIFSSCSTEESTPTYTLAVSVSPAEAGKITISPESFNYKKGEKVTLTAEPNEKWVFENWEVDGIRDSNPLVITINSDKSITAKFSRIKTEIVDVFNPVTKRTWMDRNLGATRAAISSTDAASFGDLYQWGRATDGHEIRTSSTTSNLSKNDVPEIGKFILSPNEPTDWRSPQNNNLWQGVKGINNPCPNGYRLPTEAEWTAERDSWNSRNSAGAFSSPLKLPSAGLRSVVGQVGLANTNGEYWSSTTLNNGASFNLSFFTWARLEASWRGEGLSVRCIKD